MTTEKMNQGEYTKLNFPDAPAVLAARTAPASATAAAAAGGGAGIVPQKRAASKPVSTLMGAYYRESSNTWWSTLTLHNNRKRYLGSYSNAEDAAAAFAFAKSFQNEELPKQEVFSELFGRIKYSNKPETYKRKRETVRSHDM